MNAPTAANLLPLNGGGVTDGLATANSPSFSLDQSAPLPALALPTAASGNGGGGGSGVAKLHTLQAFGLEQAVFIPIPYGQKGPRIPGWQTKTLADMARPEYQALFDDEVNVGVLLGRASGGLCVIDIDDEAEVEPFLALNPSLRQTLRTKGSRGCSLWVKVDGEFPRPGRLNRSGVVTHAMEWRADGQQCVIQGRHPEGNQYQMINPVAPITLPFADINWPAGLIKPWDEPVRSTVVPNPANQHAGTGDEHVLAQARAHMAQMPEAISGQGGHNRTFAVACALVKGFNLSIEEARPLMEEYNHRCRPVWTATELEHKLNDAESEPDTQPRGYLLPPTPAPVNGDLPIVRLPGHSISINESARRIFLLIAPAHEIFNRGGGICELVEQNGGRLSLEVIRPSAFRSRVEQYASLEAERVGKNEAKVFKPSVMPKETAEALLDTIEARELLPSITGVVNCPVLRAVGCELRMLGRGYDSETGLLISGGQSPPEVPLAEAVCAIQRLFDEFDFPTEGDRSRAIASLLTPAFKLGGFIAGKVPADVAEADQSQAGKTYRQRVIAAIYNEILSIVVRRAGGVGSIDESFAQQLISGNPFIQIDNVRDKLDSQYLESFMTAKDTFPARVPHSCEITVNPEWFFVFLTSNGVNTTKDFANRSSIIRIRKRERFQFRQYDEGDLLAHVQANQNYLLGCVFAVIREWVRQGRQRTAETRHDFREWVQIMDWVIQHPFHGAPLMDGHAETQERISNPALTLLRTLALHVVDDGRLGVPLTATILAELCETYGVEIPGLKAVGDDAARKRIGVLMGTVFKDTLSVTLDDFQVTRTETSNRRLDGEGFMTQKNYTFQRLPAVAQPMADSNGV